MVLTRVLTRAVPEVHVKKVEILYAPEAKVYFILVYPSHVRYWERFKRTYPHWKQIACKYKVLKWSLTPFESCPVFRAREDLINWVADTLGLSQGEGKFIQFDVGARTCRRSL